MQPFADSSAKIGLNIAPLLFVVYLYCSIGIHSRDGWNLSHPSPLVEVSPPRFPTRFYIRIPLVLANRFVVFTRICGNSTIMTPKLVILAHLAESEHDRYTHTVLTQTGKISIAYAIAHLSGIN